MTLLLQEGRYGIGGRTEASAPTGEKKYGSRGVGDAAPYGQLGGWYGGTMWGAN